MSKIKKIGQARTVQIEQALASSGSVLEAMREAGASYTEVRWVRREQARSLGLLPRGSGDLDDE
jgi:molybdenum-dependent DNA-binding transcriptional regulator ModE